MHTVSAKLTFYIPHSNSLKDKRQICRSIIDKSRQKFNASISEIDAQDLCRTLIIGVAVVSGEMGHARQSLDEIIRFMDGFTCAELTDTEEI